MSTSILQNPSQNPPINNSHNSLLNPTAPERHDHDGSLAHHRNIDAFPAETLCHIFLLLTKGEFDEHKLRVDETKNLNNRKFALYPCRLLEVCTRWREICLDDPILWSYISLDGHDCTPEKRYDIAPFRRIRLQIERSRDVELSVDATRMCRCKCEVARFRALAAHAHRWRTATLSTSHSLGAPRPSPDFLRSLIPENLDFSSLKEIECWFNFTNSDFYTFSVPLNCNTLHSLRSAIFRSLWDHEPGPIHHALPLVGDHPPVLDTTHAFPWSQLDTLILDDFVGDIPCVMDILNDCTSLVQFKLTPGHSPFYALANRVAQHPTVDVPRLTSFALVAGVESGNLTSFLTYVNAPNLCILDLDYTWSSPDNIPVVQAFLNSCKTSLTTLSLHHPVATNARQFLLMLKAQSQNLRHFCLRGEPLEDPGEYGQDCNGFLEGAAQRDSNTGEFEILPRLEHLELEDIGFDPLLLAQMVEARTRTGVRSESSGTDGESPPTEAVVLQSLTIRWYCDKDDEDLARARYHTEAAEEVLEDFVRNRRLRLKTFVVMKDS